MAYVDSGRIVGGFARAYDASSNEDVASEIVARIATLTGVDRSVDAYVNVTLADGTKWTRPFRGLRNDRNLCLFTTPDPYVLGIISGGSASFVDVRRPDELLELPTWITSVASDIEGGVMFFGDDHFVSAFDGRNILWTSRNMSFCGIEDLRYSDGVVTGIACDTEHAVEIPFVINAATGVATGGFEWLSLGNRIERSPRPD